MAASDDQGKKGCCSTTPLKIILAVINVFFLLFGALLIVVGALAINGVDRFDTSSGDVLESIPDLADEAGLTDAKKLKGDLKLDASVLSQEFAIAFIVVGAILFLLSIEGFMGVCGKETCALWLYCICVALMLLVQVACVIAFFAGALVGPVRGRMLDMIEQKYEGFDAYDSSESVMWNYFMLQFKCCGLDGCKDFKKAKKWDNEREFGNDTMTLIWPIACCKFDKKFKEFKNASCAQSLDEDSSNHNTGCWDKIVDTLKAYETRAIVAIVIVFLFQVAIIVITAVLISVIRKEAQQGNASNNTGSQPNNKNRVQPVDEFS